MREENKKLKEPKKVIKSDAAAYMQQSKDMELLWQKEKELDVAKKLRIEEQRKLDE